MTAAKTIRGAMAGTSLRYGRASEVCTSLPVVQRIWVTRRGLQSGPPKRNCRPITPKAGVMGTRPGRATLQTVAAGRLRVVGGVLVEKLFLVLGQIVGGEDRIRGASRNAGATIDTTNRIDIELGRRFKLRLVFLGVDAVGWADFHTKLVLDAAVGDYIGHDCFS